jgi:transcriptional regulator with XRE-family HTH domain
MSKSRKSASGRSKFARRPFRPDDRLNAVGGVLRRARNALGWSQARFAAECQLAGWDVDRVIVAKIEARLRAVSDWEVLKLCAVAGLGPGELLGVEPLPADLAACLRTRRRGMRARLRGAMEA